MYDFSIPGGGFVSFYDLIEVLGISKQDIQGYFSREVDADNDANEYEDGVYDWYEETGINTQDANSSAPTMLSGVDVSENTRKFVAYVESVEFSNPELVWVGKVENENTVGGIKEEKRLEVEYSAHLTEEQIEEINTQTVEAGDWALIETDSNPQQSWGDQRTQGAINEVP